MSDETHTEDWLEKIVQKEIDEILRILNPGLPYKTMHPRKDKLQNRLRLVITQLLKEERARAWKEAGAKVEDVFAEFGDQGIECVAGILNETFYGGKDELT